MNQPANEVQSIRKIIAASSVGTLIEWYDFYIFGSLATVIASQFFPKTNPTAALLSTLATFAAGFIVRPFGALVFGRLGDLIGRKYTFLLNAHYHGQFHICNWSCARLSNHWFCRTDPCFNSYDCCKDWHWEVNMAAPQPMLQNMHRPTEEVILLPGYKQPQHLVYFYHLGIILITRHSLDTDRVRSIAKFNEWGWRIPFLVSIFLVIVSIYIRLRMKESPLYAKLKTEGKTSVNPLKESFAHQVPI